MKKNDLSVFKMEKEGFKITLKKGIDFQPLVASALPSLQPPPVTIEETSPLKEITSPMVGTFYASPSQEAGPCVTVGQEVTEDSVVCIIEAMKVLNEIKAEMRGAIAEVVAENGKPVQYGQPLFRVK